MDRLKEVLQRAAYCGYAWSQAQLEERLGISGKVILPLLHRLETQGLVRREKEGRNESHWYWAGERDE